jgi:hypothetical protein
MTLNLAPGEAPQDVAKINCNVRKLTLQRRRLLPAAKALHHL